MNIKSLKIFVPFKGYLGKCHIEFEDGTILTEQVDDALDFVLDIYGLYEKDKNISFENTFIEIYGFRDTVIGVCKNDTRTMIPIYADFYKNIITKDEFNLSVPQYLYKYYLLYINACKYLQSIDKLYHENLDLSGDL